MRRFPQQRPTGMFGTGEMRRLVVMIGMLVVLGLMLVRARDPNTWKWLAGEDGGRAAAPPAVAQGRQHVAVAKPLPEKENKPDGPTDLDPAEWDAAQEQFEAVVDGTLAIQPEEMPAYNRLLQWVQHQTLTGMLQRADRSMVYTQFAQRPEEYRGRLVSLELNVCRVLTYQKDGLPLYEVWGWTKEAKVWLYVGVVVDLPNDVPIGPNVSGEATLVGYFFKLQGYLEAGAAARAAPLKAPLLIGRLDWHRQAPPARMRSTVPTWIWLVLGLIVVGAAVQIGVAWWRLKRRQARQVVEAQEPPRRSNPPWLSEQEDEDLPGLDGDNDFDEDR